MSETLAAWRDFYELLGTASATMIGLLFVAASVGSGVFSSDRLAPLRMFLTASVIHFSSILAISLFALTPLRSQTLFGALVIAGGLFGLAYYAITGHDSIRDGLYKRIDLEDRLLGVLRAGDRLADVGRGLHDLDSCGGEGGHFFGHKQHFFALAYCIGYNIGNGLGFARSRRSLDHEVAAILNGQHRQ